MSNDSFKVGLVLSGGGAIGAYQVGVIKALIEMGAQVDMVSGASIGALNGAILASAPSLREGVKRMEDVWTSLGENSPLKMNSSVYLNYLLSAGLTLASQHIAGRFVSSVGVLARGMGATIPSVMQQFQDDGLLSDEPLTQKMEEYLSAGALNKGLPLYVSVYETQGGITDILNCLEASIGISDTKDSEFIHIQSLPEGEQKNALLASAALPLLFSPKQVGEKMYSDGGMGGWQKMQGNTPITPLLDAGCNLIIVSHLTNGSLWDRHDFPEATILEIRPQSTLSRSEGFGSGVKDLLGFKPEQVKSWSAQGYQDTMLCSKKIIAACQARSQLSQSEKLLEQSLQNNAEAEWALASAMKRLNQQ